MRMEQNGSGRKKKQKRIMFALAVLLAALVIILQPAGQQNETVPEYVFSYAENQAQDYPTTLGAIKFAEMVEERTEGRIRILVYAEGGR